MFLTDRSKIITREDTVSMKNSGQTNYNDKHLDNLPTNKLTCTGTATQDRKEKLKSPRFAFLKISYQPTASTFAFARFLFFNNGTGKSKRAYFSRPAITLCMVTAFLSAACFAQQPQEPQFNNFEPVNTAPHYTNSKLTQQYNRQTTTQNNAMGATVADIINQQNQKASQMIGAPIYTAGMTPEQRQQANMQYIQQQMMNDPAYQTPNSSNGFANPAMQKEKEMMNLMNEMNTINQKIKKSGHYESAQYKADLPNYQNAFNKLKNMLEGKTPLSLADALYAEESAYGNLQMSYKEYKQNITECAAFSKQWMLENGLNSKNHEMVHLAIQKFMGDTLTIKNNKPDNIGGISLPNSHKPFMYDYIDYRAEKDLNNYFLTKTLATGTGQCNTLPRVYLVLAEALGVNASLTFAPQHSFIKYQNNKGTFENYEPTIDWHMSDQDYTEQLSVMSSAIANGIYLKPLNKKEMIASIMIDLAYNFSREHWMADGKFMNECLDYALSKTTDSEGLLLKNLMFASKLDRVLEKNNITDLNDIEKYPEAVQAYKDFQDSENLLQLLGIQQFPESKYKAMLEKHDGRGKLQMAKNIDTKSKKSLFFTLQTQ
ncbi:MAG: hypothetical protein HYY40_07825 [Bacteroidetes bacterium]|nr:hypothetical protein [Bacteroidota bacterium]